MVTIVWGAVFGSPWQMPRAEELRRVGLGQIISMQLLSGSLSGALAGAFFASLYALHSACIPDLLSASRLGGRIFLLARLQSGHDIVRAACAFAHSIC